MRKPPNMFGQLKKIGVKIGVSAIGAGIGASVAGPFGAVPGAGLAATMTPAITSALEEFVKGSVEELVNGLPPDDAHSRHGTPEFVWDYFVRDIKRTSADKDNFCDLHFREERPVLDFSRVHGELNSLFVILKVTEMLRSQDPLSPGDDIAGTSCMVAARYASAVRDTAIFKNSKRSRLVPIANFWDYREQDVEGEQFPPEIESLMETFCPPNLRETFYLGWIRNCQSMGAEFSFREERPGIYSSVSAVIRSRALQLIVETLDGAETRG